VTLTLRRRRWKPGWREGEKSVSSGSAGGAVGWRGAISSCLSQADGGGEDNGVMRRQTALNGLLRARLSVMTSCEIKYSLSSAYG